MSTSSEASFKVLEKISDSYVEILDEDLREDLSSLNSVTSFSAPIDKVLQYFYKNGLNTDVTFHVRCGDGYISFSCHKLVLSIWSPVFAKMFFNKESSETVEISDMSPSAFEVMIKFCYGIETEMRKYHDDVNFLLKIYKGASDYKVKGLQMLCCEIFSCALPTKDNVFELLDAASFIGSESLKHRCYKIIQTQTTQLICRDLFDGDLFDVSRSVVNIILDMTSLSLNSEFELIAWIFAWGVVESEKCKAKSLRDTMTPFLSRLNFLSLKPVEFGQLVWKYGGFFDEKEGLAIFMNIVCPDSYPLPPWCGRNINRSFSGNK